MSRISGQIDLLNLIGRKANKKFCIRSNYIYIYMSGNRGKCGRMRFEGELRLKVE